MRSIIGTLPGLPPTPFNSPPLLRLLAEWHAEEAPAVAPAAAEPRGTQAERLGQWLDWTDAIALSAVLNSASPGGKPDGNPNGKPPGAAQATTAAAAQTAAMAHAMVQVRSELARSIRSGAVFAADDADGSGADFAPWRRACQARQRAMVAAISPLRAQLRAALAATSPALAQLAALDATLDAALGERERHLLQAVPQRLEQHFQRLRLAQQPGWLAVFKHAMQAALLAELDLRLQPAQALLDALVQPSGQAL